MPLLKLWFDLRFRIYLIAALMILITAVHVVAFPYLKAVATQSNLSQVEIPDLKRFMNDYKSYVEMRWYQDAEILTILAVLLSLGGVLAEKRSRTISLTLSFPTTRRKWLLMQAAFVFFLLLALTLVSCMIFFIGGLIFHENLRLSNALAATLLIVLVASPWVGITFLISSLTQDRLMAAVIAIGGVIFLNVAEMVFPFTNSWVPKTLMTAVTYGSVSAWKPLCVILVSAGLSLLLAVWRFEQMDY